MPNSAIGSKDTRHPGSTRRGQLQARGVVDPVQVARWLEERQPEIARRWLAEIRSRGAPEEGDLAEILDEFVGLLTSLLPGLLGPLKEQVEPLWHQGAELYGNAGALRGLASGEAIEEFQVLREVLIRQLYRDPPGEDLASLGLREALVLNRIVDDGVAFAGVGHTDSLFFALFQGAGVSDNPTPEVMQELRGQVEAIREEFDRVRSPN